MQQPATGAAPAIRADLATTIVDPRAYADGTRIDDAFRAIRFRDDRRLFADGGRAFQMEMLPPGFSFQDKIEINVVRGGPGPSLAELEAAGVRRVSTGGGLSRVAYTALQMAAAELAGAGTFGWTEGILSTGAVNKLMTGQ